jgi:hypothetical protein
LLDLTRRDPANEENDTQLRVVLQLMKLARQKRTPALFFNGSQRFPPVNCLITCSV